MGLLSGGLTGDPDTQIDGITGDPDTSITEYGGLLGYGYSDTTGGTDPEDDPTFNSPEEQADGATIIDGGFTNDAETNAPGEAGDVVVSATPWWVWALAGLVVLVLLSDYAALAANVGGS